MFCQYFKKAFLFLFGTSLIPSLPLFVKLCNLPLPIKIFYSSKNSLFVLFLTLFFQSGRFLKKVISYRQENMMIFYKQEQISKL